MTTTGPEDPTAYIKLAAILRSRITSGEIRPGNPVPSITTLAQQTGHSRGTCAHAMHLLVGERLLTRYPGLGYYVTPPLQDNRP